MTSKEPDSSVVITRTVGVANITVDDLEYLRARAIRLGTGRSDSAIVRDTIAEFVEHLRSLE